MSAAAFEPGLKHLPNRHRHFPRWKNNRLGVRIDLEMHLSRGVFQDPCRKHLGTYLTGRAAHLLHNMYEIFFVNSQQLHLLSRV